MKKARTTNEEGRLEGRKRRRLSLPADRCENQGAERLAGRDARAGPKSHQRGRPRSGRASSPDGAKRNPGPICSARETRIALRSIRATLATLARYACSP